jgi:hypothetical protein
MRDGVSFLCCVKIGALRSDLSHTVSSKCEAVSVADEPESDETLVGVIAEHKIAFLPVSGSSRNQGCCVLAGIGGLDWLAWIDWSAQSPDGRTDSDAAREVGGDE